MSIILLLAAQAVGQEITTFYPLPSQRKPEQQQQSQEATPTPPPAPAPKEANAAPKPAEPAEEMKVLSVREVPPTANVIFVPPPD